MLAVYIFEYVMFLPSHHKKNICPLLNLIVISVGSLYLYLQFGFV